MRRGIDDGAGLVSPDDRPFRSRLRVRPMPLVRREYPQKHDNQKHNSEMVLADRPPVLAETGVKSRVVAVMMGPEDTAAGDADRAGNAAAAEGNMGAAATNRK